VIICILILRAAVHHGHSRTTINHVRRKSWSSPFAVSNRTSSDHHLRCILLRMRCKHTLSECGVRLVWGMVQWILDRMKYDVFSMKNSIFVWTMNVKFKTWNTGCRDVFERTNVLKIMKSCPKIQALYLKSVNFHKIVCVRPARTSEFNSCQRQLRLSSMIKPARACAHVYILESCAIGIKLKQQISAAFVYSYKTSKPARQKRQIFDQNWLNHRIGS